MRFDPWTPKQSPKPFVFIVDANGSTLEICDAHGGSRRYTTVQGGSDALMKLGNKVVVYSLIMPAQLILFGGAQNWKVIYYHDRPQRLIYQDTISIYAFSTFGPDPQALLPFFDALRELGIGPSSLSTMAKNSWRRTLSRRYSFIEWGKGPKIGRAAFHGGRKEALQPLPGLYSGVKYLDLSAAYLQAMSDPIPVQLYERSDLQWCDEGIAYANVRIPRESWNPLPFRVARGKRGIDIQVYAYGKARGYFILSELRNAVENHGVTAELIRVWKGYPIREPFVDWLPWAFELRKLPGASGLAAKHLTTRLWSVFARNPEKYPRVEVTFEDSQGKRKRYAEIPGASNTSLDGTVFISAIVASRVRQRLLEELIPAGAVQVDTDGGWVPSTAQVPGWAEKRQADVLEVRSPQAYRWRCPDCGRGHPRGVDPGIGPRGERPFEGWLPDSWHYKVSGIRPNEPFLPSLFEHTTANQLLRVKSQAAVAIPAQPLEDAKQWLNSQDTEPMGHDGSL
jgi:hypothetical protein